MSFRARNAVPLVVVEKSYLSPHSVLISVSIYAIQYLSPFRVCRHTVWEPTFCLFESRDEALHPSIKFDMGEETDGKLEFLDIVITKVPNSAAPNVFTKIRQTDKGLLYHFSSFIPEESDFSTYLSCL